MKSLKYFMGALCVGAMMFAMPACDSGNDPNGGDPVITPEDSAPEPEAPANGDYLIVVKFNADICNDIVWAGTYNQWSTDPAAMSKFAALEGYEGWYYVQFADTNATVQGKPVQLKSDGSFSWDYQSGDADAWTVESGEVLVEAGFAGEANLTYNSKVAVMKMAYWKNNGSPCVVVPTHDYTVNVTVPEGSTAAYIVGDFNSWAFQEMTATSTANVFSYTFNDAEGHAFKIVPAASWDDEAVYADGYNADSQCYTKSGNIILGTETTVSITVANWLSKVTECPAATE